MGFRELGLSLRFSPFRVSAMRSGGTDFEMIRADKLSQFWMSLAPLNKLPMQAKT